MWRERAMDGKAILDAIDQGPEALDRLENAEAQPAWLAIAESMTVMEEHVKAIEDAVPVWLKLVWRGQYHVWCAPPNAGKTAIATHAAAEMAKRGYQVYYFNLDAGAVDIKFYFEHAKQNKYRLLAPMRQGTSEEDCTKIIDAMVLASDLTGVVVILDTLKKFCDLMGKRTAPAFFRKLRALTRNGCTVIALAHTTKYASDTGELKPDGVGDLKSDTDNLMLLYHVKDEATGNLTVSTKFDKERAFVEDETFCIAKATRTVTREGSYRDTQTEAAMRAKEAADQTVIEFIQGQLPANLTQLITAARAELGTGRRTVERVLRIYTGRHWNSERATASNERRFRRAS